MPHQTVQLSQQVLRDILRPPVWDPVPEWLELDDKRLRLFAELEIQFKIKELQLQQEKLQEFGEIIG